MIFGFNTDIKHGDIVYHVQSEVRQGERAIQTQVFVRGRCIGKRAVPLGDPEPDEASVHEMLKAQHRDVVEAIRAGKIETLFATTAPAVRLEWLNAAADPEAGTMRLRFRISSDGLPATGARVLAHVETPGHSSPYVEGVSTADGTVELSLPFDPECVDAAFVAQATHGARTTTQRFRLRRKSQ
ncbi:MAG: hypothetical protein ACE14L_01415 [Terriglobales bacterium]